MFANVGTVDRVIRAIAGVGLIGYAAVAHGAMRWVGLLGVVLLVTAIVRFCPAYWLARIRTVGQAHSGSR